MVYKTTAQWDLKPHYGNGFFGNVYLLALDLKHLKIIVKIGSNYILGFRNLHMHIYLQDVRK